MTTRKSSVSPPAQRDYRVLGGTRPSGADAVARAALSRAKSAAPKPAIHVTKRERGWAVKTAGSERASAIEPSKAVAMRTARASAAKRDVRVVEHGRDGKIVDNIKPRKPKA
jgi:hypothetical protein